MDGLAATPSAPATPAIVANAPARSQTRIALAVMVASGCAGLGYQIVWTQQCALWLGQDAAAVLAVITAFFGGLAAGGLLLGPRIAASARPAHWYAACEFAIAAWCLLLAVALEPVSDALRALIGADARPAWQAIVAFGGTALLLLPATLAMGATLPAMARTLAAIDPRGARFPLLYAGNTLGAVCGVLAVAFWSIPALGLLRSAALCAVLNVACGVAALRLARVEGPAPARAGARERATLWVLAITGLLGIGYEVLVVRVLSQVAEDTVYTFAILLAVYLVFTAFGAALYPRLRAAVRDPLRTREQLLSAQAAACLAGAATLWSADAVRAAVTTALGGAMAAALAAEAAISLAAFALPTLVMGALFSHLAREARGAGHDYGTALGANTLGAALAPVLFGAAIAPAAGHRFAVLSIVAGYLLLALATARRSLLWTGAAIAAVAGGLVTPALVFVDVPEGGRVVSVREGAAGVVSVVEDANGVATLRINNRQQEGSSATLLADGRQGMLPLLLHPAPRRALFLGLGTGVTSSVAALDQAVRIDVVELLPEVIAASQHFTAPLIEAGAGGRVQTAQADARRFVRAAAQRYDTIVADNFHPARSGSGALYTVEHFRAIRARLNTDGVFCQWLPLHQLDLDTLRTIVRSFGTVFPRGGALLATYSLETPVIGLVARADDKAFDVPSLRARLLNAGGLRPPQFGFADDLALFGSFIAGPHALATFAADAPLNTDDRPVVAYRAPRVTYAPDSLPRERLMALLRELGTDATTSIVAGADETWLARLAAYGRARNRYLDAGRSVTPSNDVRRMLVQVQGPLTEVLRLSPDFRPAYDPLLRLAVALARTDAAAARALLAELQALQPARPEAEQALRRLSQSP